MDSTVRTKGAVLGLLVSAVLFYFAVRKVKFEDFSTVLLSANYRYLIPTILAFIAFYSFKAYRWRMLLGSSSEIGMKDYVYPLMVGFAANNVLPFRAGEVIRVYLGGITLKTAKARILGSLVAERLFDLLAVGSIVVAAIVASGYFNDLSGISAEETFSIAFAMIGIVTVLVLVVVLASRYKLRIDQLLTRWLSFQIRSHIVSFLSGFDQSRDISSALWIVSNSVLQWLALTLCVMWSIQAVGATPVESVEGLNNGVSLLAVAAFTMGVIVLGISMPSTVAFIGTIEYAFVLSLGFFDISPALALAAGVFYHIIAFSVTTVSGLLCYLLYRWQYQRSGD